jgi:hypothetical protein
MQLFAAGTVWQDCLLGAKTVPDDLCRLLLYLLQNGDLHTETRRS